ncbi:hypothetical protein P4B35_14500 [Pontiellaceae bacterium B12227]|nr:hypothetical protein [Pontiellaceae bacterium B12227]
MMQSTRFLLLAPLLIAPALSNGQDLDTLMQNGELKAQVQSRSERVILDEATAAEQARAQAKSRSEFGMELRPRITDSEVGVALRMYLPDRWNKDKLREQLMLVAQSEQLRVSALEWDELLDVYRGFCEYRMFNKQLEVFNEELQWLEPYLEKANEGVELNQLTVTERAKLYSLYLELVNNHEQVKHDLLDIKQELRLLLGHGADLEKMSTTALVGMPKETEFNTLMQQALSNRSDYKQFDLQYRSLQAAEEVAVSDDGFRLKYIQPFYEVDYNNGENTIGLSASFVLPWGTRNPDIAVFQQEQLLTESAKNLHRSIIEHRLRVLMKSAESYYGQDNNRNDRIKPLLNQLNTDLETMNTGRLEELRDLMLIRERILDVSLQTTRSNCQKEQIAVELARELGSLTN